MNIDEERRINARLREIIDDIKVRIAVVESSVNDMKKFYKIVIVTVCVIAAGKSILEVIK